MGYRTTLKEDYDFEVIKNDAGGYYGNESAIIEGEEVEGKYPAHPKNKEFAVKQMELFVKRVTEALEKLKNLP